MTLNSTSIPAASPPTGKVPNFEHPEDVLNTINLVSQILAVATVTLFVFVRLFIKTVIVPPFLIEDCVLVVAWALSVGFSTTAFMMHHYGGGNHVWELPVEKYEGFLKSLYADTVVYGPNAYFTKLALLLVVARVFNPLRTTKLVTYALIVGMLGYYIPVMIIKIFICRPIHAFWDVRGVVKATCFNQRAIFVADTIISTVTDLAVLILPIPAVISLQMPFKQKVKVWSMLGIGGIATGASFVRMVIVIRLQKSQDQTVDFVRFNLLGTAEVSIGLICACLPATNILYSRLCHAWGTSRTSVTTLNQPFTSFSQKAKHLKFLKGSRLETSVTLTNNNNTRSGDDGDIHPIFERHSLHSHSTVMSGGDAEFELNVYPVPEIADREIHDSMELGR